MTKPIGHRSNVVATDDRRGREPMSQVVQAPSRIDARTIAGSTPPCSDTFGIYGLGLRGKYPWSFRTSNILERAQEFN